MTKSDFILALSEALVQLPGSARSRVLEYFEEMIDDRIESGMSEEEAVAAMGSVDEIVREVAPEAEKAQFMRAEESASKSGAESFEFRYPVENLVINSCSAKLHVFSGELPDGVTAKVDCKLSENEECVCGLENGTLKIKYRNQKQRGFSLRNLFGCGNSSITVMLSNAALVRGEIAAGSGDIRLNGLVFTDSLEVGSASGNQDLLDVAVHTRCKLHAASGDITVKNLTCGEQLEMHTASGDVDLFDVRAGKIDVGTASGDPTLGSIECDDLHVGTASGDADLRNIRSGAIDLGSASGDLTFADSNCTGAIEMNSTSGDIEIRNISCDGVITLHTISGDVNGKLMPVENYTFHARSRTGDVKIPYTNGSCHVKISTTSGDIRF